jgi:hypothetical protein
MSDTRYLLFTPSADKRPWFATRAQAIEEAKKLLKEVVDRKLGGLLRSGEPIRELTIERLRAEFAVEVYRLGAESYRIALPVHEWVQEWQAEAVAERDAERARRHMELKRSQLIDKLGEMFGQGVSEETGGMTLDPVTLEDISTAYDAYVAACEAAGANPHG